MRVLIVDDNEITLMVLEEALRAGGYEVEIAHNGQEALAVLQKGSCRMVVSDWEMPQMSGVELCRHIRSDCLRSYVYIILLTSRSKPEERVQGLRAGADDFVSKPFDNAELIARIGAGERVLSLETRDVAIFAMAKLAESRDPETGTHLERVRSYSRVLAQHLTGVEKFQAEMTAEFVRLIYLTSPLHDIGKVGIPDHVLLKPGRLSDREFSIMKTHAAIGAQTLDAALREFPGVEFLRMGRDIAATHHERYDGSGYPNGLKGESSPLCGRIVALADVYDALTSRRIYKDSFTHEVARSMILAESGSHFDPEIVAAFTQTEARFLEILERFAEIKNEAA
jgi:putative two-component system response regulator